MELKDIKARLSIQAVLQHYGLRPDKNSRLLCPFHPDKTPSLQIYPRTNTFCCFSSNCTAGTGDVVQFIQLKESCSKHEALVKAASLASGSVTASASGRFTQSEPVLPPATALSSLAELLAREAVLTKMFQYFKKALPLTKKATAYLEGRSLEYKGLEAGYNSGDWHHKLNEVHFLKSCEALGLLKPKPAAGYSAWAKDCIIFPLRNQEHKIVSLYGRSITNATDQRHFYLAGRQGLYPGYPKLTTKQLLLTESIIDAASLLQQPEIKEQYEVLALYGTNGLTEEHLSSIKELPQLEEIILMLNADEPGAVATAKHAATLRQLLPQVRITTVPLPAGDDVNSVLQAHDDPKVLSHLIKGKKDFFFSTENGAGEKEKQAEAAPQPPALSSPNSRLNAQNPELLVYEAAAGGLCIEVLGGIKITGLDRMKVTLKVLHKEKLHPPQWYSLDLYNQQQREGAISSVAESFDTGMQQTTQAFTGLITELEAYRLGRIEALQPKPEVLPEMTPAQRQQALAELKKPGLLKRTAEMITLSGLVGEQTNALIAYLVYTMRRQPIPLHVLFLGSSGSGKTYLQERISELMPPEDKIEITQITENALYYFKQQELKHKLILIEDLDGALSVFYPLRELQTKRRISKTVTLKDSKGNLKTITLTVEGPVCVSGCTTKEKLYEDNANRCLLLYTDQSREQDSRINDYQVRLAAGEVNRHRESQYRELFQNMQRLLRPLHILNPYAKYIELPEQVFKPRRTMTLLLGFIEAVTFYHQHQREVKRDAQGQPYIETTVEDIEAALTLLKDVLFSKSDELAGATRSFFERLKHYLAENKLESFTPQQIRKAFRLEPRTIQRYIKDLKQYGYVRQVGGFQHRKGFEYSVSDAEEYRRLTSEIGGHLQGILEKLRQMKATAQCATTATPGLLSQ